MSTRQRLRKRGNRPFSSWRGKPERGSQCDRATERHEPADGWVALTAQGQNFRVRLGDWTQLGCECVELVCEREITFFRSNHLPFSDHVHQFNSCQDVIGGTERFE